MALPDWLEKQVKERAEALHRNNSEEEYPIKIISYSRPYRKDGKLSFDIVLEGTPAGMTLSEKYKLTILLEKAIRIG